MDLDSFAIGIFIGILICLWIAHDNYKPPYKN
jgi:hypothetical protein